MSDCPRCAERESTEAAYRARILTQQNRAEKAEVEVAELSARLFALEQQRDHLRAVAEAAKRWREMPRRSPHPAEWLDAETALVAAVDALAAARLQGEKT